MLSEAFRLVDSGWDAEIERAIRKHPRHVRIVCPFIKQMTAKRLLTPATARSIQVITRFNLQEFCEEVSDIGALRLLQQHGAEIRGIWGLHAKL